MNTNEDSIFLELEDAEVVNHMIIGKAMTMFLKGTKTIQENSSSEEFNVQKKEQMQIAHVLNILNQNKEIVKENVVDNELLGETVKELLNLKTSSRILAKAIKYHLDQHEKIMLFGNKPSCETCEEIFKSLIEDVDSNKIKMLPTGFKYLDINLNGGLSENGIHILAGPSGKGKSAFSIQIANYAASNGKVVLYFSIEMSPHQNLARVISSIDDSLSSKDILANTLTSEQKVRLKSIENRLKHQKLIFSKSRNIVDIKDDIEKYVKEYGSIDLVVVDYLQIVEPEVPSTATSEMLVTQIVKSLKIISQKHKLRILALAQMNEKDKTSGKDDLGVGNLRSSAAIGHYAETIMFICHEPAKEIKTKSGEYINTQPTLTLQVVKNRNGSNNESPSITFDYHYFYSTGLFRHEPSVGEMQTLASKTAPQGATTGQGHQVGKPQKTTLELKKYYVPGRS